jgi:secondary thiamine-phosphate synthase enzyme
MVKSRYTLTGVPASEINSQEEPVFMVVTHEFNLSCNGYCDIQNITEPVAEAVRKSGLNAGIATVFTPSATSAITAVEYESGMLSDFEEFFERVASQAWTYKHNERWHDGNGFSHIRAALLGPSLSVPFVDGSLILGTWQQIAFLDFDNRHRQRRVVVQLVGE